MKENGKRLDWIINEPALVFSLEESVFIGSLRSASWLTSVIIVPLVARTRLKKKKGSFFEYGKEAFLELVSNLLPFFSWKFKIRVLPSDRKTKVNQIRIIPKFRLI